MKAPPAPAASPRPLEGDDEVEGSTLVMALVKTTRMQVRLFLRYPASAFFALAFPSLLLLFLSGAYQGSRGRPSPELIGLVPGFVAMLIATVGLSGMATDIASYRERGVLRRFRVTPLSPWTVVASTVLSNVLVTFAGVVILVAVARLALGLPLPRDLAGFLVGLAMGLAGFFSMAFVLAAVVPAAKTAGSLASILFYPMIFLSGAVMPVGALPPLLRHVYPFVPLTYVVQAMQDPWINGSWNLTALGLLATALVGGLAFSAKVFRWE
jgi:ABC-2 type transport system permease protein